MRCRGGKICHNVTRAEHASRKKCFVTLSPVSRGTKMEMYVCFCIWVVVAVNSAVRKWKETLTSSLGRFDRLHGTGEKRTGWKWRPSPYFSIDSRWGCVTSVRGIASKIIDFLLRFILQQPLLSLLTITVGGHWIWEGGELMVASVHCSVLPNMGIENWWLPFSQVVSHQMGEGF